MFSLSTGDIRLLRTYGFNLKGYNWMRSRSLQGASSGEMHSVKIVNGDTLAIVYLPADLLNDNI